MATTLGVMSKHIADVETRLRRLERFQWLVMGGAAAVGAAASFLFGRGG